MEDIGIAKGYTELESAKCPPSCRRRQKNSNRSTGKRRLLKAS